MKENRNLHGWVFTFNTYDQNWYATTRDNYANLFSDTSQGVLKSKKIYVLVTLIKQIGDKIKIEKLITK